MKRIGRWLWPALLASAAGVAAQSVTYERALDAVTSGQPALEAGSLRVEARQSAAEAADRLPDPRLQAGIMNLPVTGPDPFDPTMMSMVQVGIEQPIPNLAKRNARAGAAEADVRRAAAGLALTERALLVGAGEAWIDLAFAQRRWALALKARDELASLIPLARGAVTAGSARPAESLEVRRAALELEDAITAIEAEQAAAQARLARFVTLDAPTAAGDLPALRVEPEKLRAAIEHNPELRMSFAEVEQAQAGVRLAQVELRPDFGIGVSYGVRERQYGDVVSVMGSVTLPLFAGRRQEPMIAAARADAFAAAAQVEDRRRALVAELEAGLADWLSAVRQWERARDELLPLARQRAELEMASFAAGRAGLDDVVSARVALALFELELLEREARAAKAAATLNLTYEEDVR
jgi:outer membrane protein TolC